MLPSGGARYHERTDVAKVSTDGARYHEKTNIAKVSTEGTWHRKKTNGAKVSTGGAWHVNQVFVSGSVFLVYNQGGNNSYFFSEG